MVKRAVMVLDSTDYYGFMSLPRTASGMEIRAAYRRLAMRLHPDMDGSAEAAIGFDYLCQAYRCLSDEGAREAYDRELAARRDAAISVEVVAEPDRRTEVADEEAAAAAAGAAMDGRGGPRAGVTRYVVLRTPRRVPRNRLFVQFQRRDPCRRCAGSGARKSEGGDDVDAAAGTWTVCHACWGTGQVLANRKLAIAYRSRRVLGGELIVPHEGDVGERGGPRGNLLLRIITPDHTTRGLLLPAMVGALMVLFVILCVLGEVGGCDGVMWK
jgi:molecular chaperone DnaJ